MGSPDAADSMTLADVENSITNTVNTFEQATGATLGCVIPVEIGAINSIVPLLAAARSDNTIQWVIDGDGAERAVPELPQTTYGGSASLAASPCSLASDAEQPATMQSATLNDSESNGRGFSNATDDLAGYFDPATGKSTGRTVSVIKVDAAPELAKATGVVASFAGLLRSIGYAGALPYSG